MSQKDTEKNTLLEKRTELEQRVATLDAQERAAERELEQVRTAKQHAIGGLLAVRELVGE